MLDQAKNIRPGEELDIQALHKYLSAQLPGFTELLEIKQFPGGYSNLTYLVRANTGEYVLRRPPFGAKIKTAHDMGREYRVLSLLEGVYDRAPKPVLHCADETVLGASFYLMERVAGVILRNRPQPDLDLSPAIMQRISEATIDNLAILHNLELEKSGLLDLGKPEGYVGRQVSGWIERYYRAQTDTIPSMDELAAWMPANQPPDGPPGLIHNDYKYDNLVLDGQDLTQIRAVLDWEMCTVGDPLMDLGTTLAYWVEPAEANLLVSAIANLTWLPGNLNRKALVERYAHQSGRSPGDGLFYFVFGAFKIGVIVQQIYHRYKQGHTQDPRFAPLIEVVKIFGNRGRQALELGRISDLS